MAQNETTERILHAATLLFAERGFSETSLRTITGMADVNLAAVNYHFGSKKELIQAVFSRFLTPFCKELHFLLDELESSQSSEPELKAVLSCLFEALFKSTSQLNEDPQRFMRLLGLAYTQTQEHLRRYIILHYGQTYHRFIKLLSKTQPQLDPVTFYWRLHFMLGAGVFTLSSFDAIRSILNADYAADTSLEEVIEIMTSSMVGIIVPPHVEAQ